LGGQRYTPVGFTPSNYIGERENTDMDTVSWALAAFLKERQKGTSVGWL